MRSSKLRVAEVSDIHLGHPNTPTKETIDKLDLAFPDKNETGELDIIFMAGDVFDRLMHVPDESVLEARLWINRFLRMCARRDIVVRVLEGTPSHDWGQSELFESINRIGQIEADVVYQDKLCIEHIERFDIHVLYVPDEWEFETDETWRQVTQLLQDHGLEKVDFAIMHGAFSYQFPAHLDIPTHSEERYLSVVRHYIFIGHVHTHSTYDRILAGGSFDRLCHGEEEPKGHLRATIRAKGDDEILFVPNDLAKRYVTINCHGLAIDEALTHIEQQIDLPVDSHVRIQANKEDPIVSSLDTLKKQYPQFHWSSKISTDKTSARETLVDQRAKYKGIDINRENIANLVKERLEAKTQDPALLERSQTLLSEVI